MIYAREEPTWLENQIISYHLTLRDESGTEDVMSDAQGRMVPASEPDALAVISFTGGLAGYARKGEDISATHYRIADHWVGKP